MDRFRKDRRERGVSTRPTERILRLLMRDVSRIGHAGESFSPAWEFPRIRGPDIDPKL